MLVTWGVGEVGWGVGGGVDECGGVGGCGGGRRGSRIQKGGGGSYRNLG